MDNQQLIELFQARGLIDQSLAQDIIAEVGHSGKEIAEIIYARILAPLIAAEKETPFIRLLLLNKHKKKKENLEVLLRERNIDGEVYYSNKRPKGWMHLWTKDHSPQRLGYDYASAVELIEKGTMDFMARDFMKAKL